MRLFPVISALAALLFAGAAPAATINVPADQSTIQAAINAASNGDTVLVAPGTYYEQLDFLGKAISVVSSGGAGVTILDGGGTHRIVTFKTHEGNGSVLQGFTLTHAYVADVGSAIYLSSTSPTITDDIFVHNVGDDAYFGAAIGGYGAPVILRNLFADNTCGWQANASVVAILSGAAGVIADNVFVDNPCPALDVSLGSTTAVKIYNNTIVGNRAGLIISSYGTNAATFFSNNLIAFNQNGMEVTFVNGGTFLTWSHNLVYGNTTADYQGVADQTGTNGNISSDPVLKYWQGDDVHLLSSSPAIDAGDNTVAQASATDFYDDTRVYAGISGDSATVDIGAAESVVSDSTPGAGSIINVPVDQPTIQAGIDAASDGDIVLVAPGMYNEQIDFDGKTITVKSSGGAGVTTLDGNNDGPIVSFHTGEGNYSVLQGFTFTHALQDDIVGDGAALNLFNSSPTIEDNDFVDNIDADGFGSAIAGGDSPVIVRNYFTGNTGLRGEPNYTGCVILAGTSPVVVDNVFANNSLIAYCQSINTSASPKMFNNTLVGNVSGISLVYGGSPNTQFDNNVIAFNSIGIKVSLPSSGSSMPSINNNLIYGNTTADYSGITSQTGTNGNISSDPKLKNWADGDVHLLYGSPAIDNGHSTVSQALATDFYGNTRVYAGMPGDSAVVDIGAVEYEPPVVAATSGSLPVPFDVATSGALASSNADPGEPLVFALVTLPAHGTVTLTDAATGGFQYAPAQGYLGSDSFTFQITDPYGAVSNTATEQVTVALEPATANSGSVNTAIDVVATGSLSATLAYPSQVLTYGIVSNPAHGTVSLNANNGQFHYTPAQGYIGSDSFTFDVTDQYGAVSNTATEQVNVGDVAPTANNGSIATKPDTAVSSALSATAAYAGQALTFSIVSQPIHGTVNLVSSTGHFTYKPATGYVGADSFTFEVTDTHGTLSNIATESITVNDVAPRARSVQIRVSNTRWGYSSSLKATAAYAGQVLSYSVVSQPAHGIVTITNAHTGAYTYHVSGNFKGNDSFTFQAVDQWGTASNVATVSATVL